MPLPRLQTTIARRPVLQAVLAGAGSAALAGCQAAPPLAYGPAAEPAAIVYVTARGWHTGLALPVQGLNGIWRDLLRAFPGARYLLFGWGERNYYMARDPDAADALRALFPGPAVLLLTPLDRAPPAALAGEKVFALGLSRSGFDRLRAFVWAAFALQSNGAPRRVGDGWAAGSAFFAASGSYSSAYTCNTWVADALRHGGLPVTPSAVVFAGQVVAQVRPLALASNG